MVEMFDAEETNKSES